ncbi:hypothetical protein ISS85_01295 [Candidatus Microgenomates bacterium]|nr:hypothetical protein [Candidatus Microgenomates bacterium]
MKGNTEGSLSEVQKAIITGSLLGDGYMRCKINAHLEINHAYSQKEYVDWKYRHFKALVRTPPKKRQSNKGRVAYRFTTRSLPFITRFYKKFYRDKQKIIPKDIELKPLTLAVWFMDDGSRCGSQLYFNTQQFLKKDQNCLVRQLKNQWGIKSGLNRDKHYFRIRLFKESNLRLISSIKSYIIPMFSYKILI